MHARYIAPAVINCIRIELETGVLGNSQIDGNLGEGINSSGQGYSDLNFSGEDYNQNWDE